MRRVTPDGASWAPRPRVDNAMVKALARAFRWRKMLDTGVHATLEDLARAKGVHATYVSRVLRLTLLAPEIVEAILDGRQPEGLQLEDLLGVSGGVGRATHVPTCAVVSDGAAYTQSDVQKTGRRPPRRPSAKSRDYFWSGVAPVSNRVIFPSFRV